MKQEELYELFARKESGKITPAELDRFESILKSDQNKALYDKFKMIVDKKENYNNMPKFNYTRTRDKIISEIQKQEPGFSMGIEEKRPTINWFRNRYKVAAVAIVLLIIASGVIFNQIADKSSVSMKPAYCEFSTQPGENLKVDLPDGSSIRLNGSSSLRFVEHFSKLKREVQITGEAFCEIAKETKRPFIVDLGEYKVEVLGTTFNVNAYPEAEKLSVALVEGKVKVGAEQGKTIFLEPGKMVAFNRRTLEYVKSDFDFNEQLGWKNKIFRFKNTPLSEVYQQLEHRYGVSFKTGNLDVSDIRINASFDNTPFLTIITAIEVGTELSYEILENKEIKVIKNDKTELPMK
uniref:FecR family protein n=1 Tax=uncultured Draconibacterium sp. TaxID=1573823 RepID=UPI003217CB9E